MSPGLPLFPEMAADKCIRRNQFLEGQDYTSYMEKIWGTEMCIKSKNEDISTTGDYCSKSDSKEEELLSFCVECRRSYPESDRLSTRESKTHAGPWFSNRL